MISLEDMSKIKEITRLHDEAFWYLHQFDGHAKSSDGHVSINFHMGTVWDRESGDISPRTEVSIYSYVVSTDSGRNHKFESIDDALQAVTLWHSKAMSYKPTTEELEELDSFAAEMWDVIKDKVTIIDLTKDSKNLPEKFRDIANGE
jgi:hypothetical protein